ncbi:N-formylglutamate amidohydrolase [Winogradskyella forsetii]|uniref:N-formylglutamate amidohydrolase n=1 Tax=Winogradskyella forsetii TaxID=2686077 RepID=UPI0015BAFCD1|nr:N-formylglutamate amidohydrolase [Winogradskyella forsetii]
MKLVLTCEHGGNDIPNAYKNQFMDTTVLKTHRGLDLGALDLFEHLKPLADASFYRTTSRLLVELNRSLFSRQLFSEFSKNFPQTIKREILAKYYVPYRTEVEHKIAEYIKAKQQVIHLSLHSFTPELNGDLRNADIGLLFDSRNKKEQEFCKKMKDTLLQQKPNFSIRFNYPYLGKADGFTTFLRKQFPTDYLGIEIEVNQKFTDKNSMELELKDTMYKTIDGLKLKSQSF